MTANPGAPGPVQVQALEEEMARKKMMAEEDREGAASRRTRRRPCREALVTVLVMGVALGVGACGGGEPNKAVASLGSGAGAASAAATQKADPLGYARCMRENGVPKFSDPGDGGNLMLPEGVDPNSPQVKKATEACKKYMGGGSPGKKADGGWSADNKLKYAQCMRANGVPKFSDPDADGNFPALKQGSGVDPTSPQFKKANDACKKYQPEMLRNTSPNRQGGTGQGAGGGS
ncbi:hypothetical protein [Actinomadura nitritigenes]|uniref:hypothetical protein n=1 Tax=Actinomadura nitritigenes TaxID=134602 RepID=UPI003D8B3240